MFVTELSGSCQNPHRNEKILSKYSIFIHVIIFFKTVDKPGEAGFPEGPELFMDGSKTLLISVVAARGPWNHRMDWMGRDLKDHLVIIQSYGQGHLP